MKAFAVTLLLFVLMVGIIICNAIYINRMAFDLTDRLDALPAFGTEGCADAAHAFCDFWDERSTLAGLSVGFPIVDRLSEQAALLVACAEVGDLYGYCSARALLYDAIEDMRRLEKA